MSLINQMLKDLEGRQATSGEQRAMTAGIVLAAPARRRSLSWFFSIMLVVAATGAAIWFWTYSDEPASPVAEIAVTRAITDVASLAPAPSEVKPIPSVKIASQAMVRAFEPPAARVPVIQADAMPAADEATSPSKSKSVAVSDANSVSPESTVSGLRPTQEPRASSPPGKAVSAKKRSDESYRQAKLLLQQSQTLEAQQVAQLALDDNPANHLARMLLVDSLVGAGRNADAIVLLSEGLRYAPGQSDFHMKLARIHMADGDTEKAFATLEQGLFGVADNPDYHALLATLAQKLEHHEVAIRHYRTALQGKPGMATWLIRLAVSLKAVRQASEAEEVFQRAVDAGTLTPETTHFANQQLKQLRQLRPIE